MTRLLGHAPSLAKLAASRRAPDRAAASDAPESDTPASDPPEAPPVSQDRTRHLIWCYGVVTGRDRLGETGEAFGTRLDTTAAPDLMARPIRRVNVQTDASGETCQCHCILHFLS